MIEQLDAGQADVAQATAIQGFKAIHQMILDQGSWRAAWALSLLLDPYERREFGGNEAELAAVAGWLKAKADLKERVRSGTNGKDEDDEDAPTGKGGGRKGKDPKGGGRGRGAQGAAAAAEA